MSLEVQSGGKPSLSTPGSVFPAVCDSNTPRLADEAKALAY